MSSIAKATVIKSKSTEMHPILKKQNENIKDVSVEKSVNGESRAMSEVMLDDVIDPPFNFSMLQLLSEQSSILQQCVDAYKVNIAGFGLESESKDDLSKLKDSEKAEVEEEKAKLKDYLNYINLETSIEEVLEAVIDDMEKTGNGYIEILRSNDGQLSTFEHLPVENIRLCKKDKDLIDVTREIDIGDKATKKTTKRKFRRYVQIIGLDKVYFKEYGHPDDLDYKTGEYVKNLPHEKKASEILHFKIGNGVYGKPRYIGNVINLIGARKAEELNYLYFKNGRHLPAAITVSNGILDADSKKALEEYMSSAQGVENAHKFLLLEAMGDSTENAHGEEVRTNAKIDIKGLAEIIQQDALFLDYDERTRKKIRSSFRLPPLYTGEAQEYTKATSATAREITEEQVFQPERIKIARRLNAVILPEFEIKKSRVAFKSPEFTDPLEVSKALSPFIESGSASPNDLRPLLGDVLGTKLEQWEDTYNRPTVLPGNRTSALSIPPVESVQKSDNEVIHILKDLRDYLEAKDDE